MADELKISAGEEINLETGRALFEDVEKRLKKENTALILDLSGVRNMDSRGGAWILRIKQLAESLGVRFEYQGETGLVAEYLRLITPGFKYIDKKPEPAPGFFE